MKEFVMWEILGVAPTSDEDRIKAAYRTKLVNVNPEENPEGFKELRKAYEEALQWAHNEKREKSPLEQWIHEIEEIYDNFYRRIDEEEWEEVFENEVCTDLDTAEEARIQITRFLMEHYFLPQFVWKRVWEVFEFEEDRELLKEKISNDFITYIQFRAESEDYFDYQLYDGPIDADYDDYIRKSNILKSCLDDGNLEQVKTLIEDLEQTEITHPYIKIETLKYYLFVDDERWKLLLSELENELYDNLFLKELKGEILLKEENYGEAEQLFLEVLEQIPGRVETSRKLVELYQKMERYEEAKKICLDVLDNKIPDEKICNLMIEMNEKLILLWKDREDKQIDLAWCYYQNQKFEECLHVLKRLKEKGKTCFDYYNLIARVLLETGDHEKGYEMTKIWISNIEHLTGNEKDYERKSKRYGYAHFIASMHCMELGLDEKCEQYFKRALELDKEQMDVAMYRERRMESYLRRGKYEQCIKEANMALEISEFFYPAYVYRQEANYHLYRAQQVMDDFYRAIELAPDQGKPYVTVIKMLIDCNMIEDIKRILEMGENNHVKDPEFTFYSLEFERFHAQSPEKLRELAKEMKALFAQLPDKKAQILYRLGLIYDRLIEEDREALSKAIDYTREAMEEDEKIPQYPWLLADLYQKAGEFKKAIPLYQKVLELDNTLYNALIDLGNAYEALGQDEKAIEVMEKGAQYLEHHDYVHNSLMNLYLRRFARGREQEDFDKALVHADAQLEIIENDYFYRERAYLYIEDMQLENALQDIKKSYELAPDDLYALSSMGYIHQLIGDYETAIRYYEKAEKHAETKAQKFSLYRWWAPIYERAGQFENALNCYLKCQDIDREAIEIPEKIAEIYMRMNQYEKAAKYYGLAAQKNEDRKPDMMIAQATAYFYNGNRIKAAKVLKQVELSYGNESDVCCMLGEFYLEEKRDLKKAYRFYTAACRNDSEEPYMRLVGIYAAMGKVKDAKKMRQLTENKIIEMYGSMEDYLRKKEHQKSVYYKIAMMYYYSGDMEIAEKYLDEMKKQPMCYFCHHGFCFEEKIIEAVFFESREQKEEALKLYRQILKQDQNLGEVRNLKKELEKR